MPRKISLEGHRKQAQVDAMIAEGASLDKIAARLNLPRGQVQSYRDAKEEGRAKKGGWQRPRYPEVSGKTTKEQAMLHAAWLKDTIDAAIAAELSPKELGPLSGQYAAALRLVARLDGSLEITAAQILRSAEFQRCMAALQRAVGDDLAVWRRWERELATLVGET